MRKQKYLFCLVFLLAFLTACTFVGDPDFAMFTEHFNKANEKIQIDDENVMRVDEKDKTKYCYFFNKGEDSNYLVSVYQNNDNDILSNCTLSILKTEEIDTVFIEDLFCSMLYGYKEIPEDKAKKICKELELDNQTTYKANGKTEKEFDKLKVTIIVNGAGCAINIK